MSEQSSKPAKTTVYLKKIRSKLTVIKQFPYIETVKTSPFYVIKVICNHMLGEKHSFGHRLVWSSIFMIAGVLVAGIEVETKAIHVLLDALGYGMHGVAMTPIIDRASQLFKNV